MILTLNLLFNPILHKHIQTRVNLMRRWLLEDHADTLSALSRGVAICQSSFCDL